MSVTDETSGSGGPRGRPFHCTRVHVIHNNERERQERWAQVNEWMQQGTSPVDLPEWCEILYNHGGGGGP